VSIDARIPLAAQFVPIKPVAHSLRDAMQMREASDQMADRQRERTEQEAIREALRETEGDLEKALPKIRQASPTYALAVEQQVNERKRQAFALQSAELERNQKTMQNVGQILNGVTDETSYAAAVDTIHKLHDGMKLPRIAFPATYDKKHVDGLRSQALTVQQQIENAHRELQLRLTGSATGSGTEFERWLATWARDQKRPLDSVTADERLELRKKFEAASTGGGREPSSEFERGLLRYAQRIQGGGIQTLKDVPQHIEDAYRRSVQTGRGNGRDGGISAEAKATAERWKSEELRNLEATFKESFGLTTFGPERDAAEAEHEKAKLQIENSYRSQIGMPQLDALPERWNGHKKKGGGKTAPQMAPRDEAKKLAAEWAATNDPNRKAEIQKRLAELRPQLGQS
jgi:hypothetical protein